MVRRDSIAVLWRRHCGSGGTHCPDPRRLLFASAGDSGTPSISPLKSLAVQRHPKNVDADQTGVLCRSWGCWRTGTGRSLALNLLTVVVLLLGPPAILGLLRVGKKANYLLPGI